MQNQKSQMPQTASNGPNEANGAVAIEVDRLFADLHSRIQQLLQDRESLRISVRQLETERDGLLQTVAILKEKCENYTPVVTEWANRLLSPEEAEAIVRKNEWVGFEEIMDELANSQRVSQ